MSYCKKEGKDQIIFVTKEDHEAPLKLKIEEDDDESPGIILPNGEINWNCPCLGGMATGPCGVEFREAFSCFQYSKGMPKGSDCFDQFHTMQDCMTKYPALYPQADPLDMSEDDEDEESGAASSSAQNRDQTDKSNEKQDSAKSDSAAETSKSK